MIDDRDRHENWYWVVDELRPLYWWCLYRKKQTKHKTWRENIHFNGWPYCLFVSLFGRFFFFVLRRVKLLFGSQQLDWLVDRGYNHNSWLGNLFLNALANATVAPRRPDPYSKAFGLFLRKKKKKKNKQERKKKKEKPIGRFDVVKNNEKRWTAALLLVPFFSSHLNGNIYHIYI